MVHSTCGAFALSERLRRPLLSRKGRSKDADQHDARSLLPVRAAHRPGEPAMQTASVDLDLNGRAVSSPVKAYHLTGRCYDDAKAAETARREALKAA